MSALQISMARVICGGVIPKDLPSGADYTRVSVGVKVFNIGPITECVKDGSMLNRDNCVRNGID